MAMRVPPPEALCAAPPVTRALTPARPPARPPARRAFLMTSRNGDGSQYSVLPNLCLLNARHRNSLRFARVTPT